MNRIYLDNGSTSFPKAPGVSRAVADYIDNVGVNISRGGYEEAYCAATIVLETREYLCRLFGSSKPENVIFTAGVTTALNILLKGFLKPGDHVLTTSMEHNAVMRPLRQLEAAGVEISLIPCKIDGTLCTEKISEMIRNNTKLLVMTHGSNVCGTVMPVADVCRICRKKNIPVFVDSAQTGGLIPLDMEGMGIDAIAFAGHKSLLGPQGIGGFILSDQMISRIDPLISGGTGSISHLETIPSFMPDRFECGTQNLPGIYGLHTSLDFIEKTGIDVIHKHEMQCTQQLIDGLLKLDDVRIAGLTTTDGRTAAVSADFTSIDNAQMAFELEHQYGIMTRCGLHCAPSAHKTLHTYPQGTVRFTPGYSTTEEEIELTLKAVRAILSGN